MKIGITTSSFAEYSDEPFKLLEQKGIKYELNPFARKLTEDETKKILKGCAGVVAGTEPLTAQVFGALPNLKVISRCGVGLDNVDLAAAKQNGITVKNTPFGPTLAVAELTLGLVLALLRGVCRMDRELRRGVWQKRMGHGLSGKKLGIIGFGRIGQAVAAAFSPLSVEIAYSDPDVNNKMFSKKKMKNLLRWADIVSIHCSMPKICQNLIGNSELLLMQKGAFLINIARGGIVNENALYEALSSNHLGGAAVDVFGTEPYRGPLRDLDNIILTPHIGSYARESRIQMEIDAVKNLIGAL